MRPFFRLLRLSVLLVGCHGVPELGAACFEDAPTLAVSTGNPAEVYLGPQGGFHVFYDLETTGVAAESDLYLEVVDLDNGAVLADVRTHVVLDEGVGSCDLQRMDELLVLDITSAKAVAGHRVRIDASVIDLEGREAFASIEAPLAVAK